MRLFSIINTSFEKFELTIKNYMAKALNSSGLIFSNTQIYNVIMTAIKGVLQNGMFYIEDALTEQNIDTAYRKQSIYSLAKLSGYEPSYGNAAVGTVILKNKANVVLPSGSTKVYIPNGTTIRNNNTGITYSIQIPTEYYILDFSKPLQQHQFKVIQGIWTSSTHIATGYSLEAVHITSSNFDKEYIEVYVNGEKYSQAANMYDMTNDGMEYLCTIGYDNTFDIIFGDGVYGRRLTAGDTVIIRYIVHNGATGNILLDDTYDFKVTTSIYDTYGNDVSINDYTVIDMDSQISGGNDSDTIENVRRMVGYSSRSLVVTNEDNFKLFLNRFSFIGHTNIWIEPNSLTVNISALNDFKAGFTSDSDYLKLQESDIKVTDAQKDMIINTFENSKKTFMGLNIEFKDPIIRRYSMICFIKVDPSYNREDVKENLNKTISNYFINIADNTTFIAKSDIINKILNKYEYITSCDITFISKATEDAYKNGYYYKYEHKFINNAWQYIPVKYMYSTGNEIGLDIYGNISLDTQLEIPFLNGGFKYYPDKSKTYKPGETEDVQVETIQYIFI